MANGPMIELFQHLKAYEVPFVVIGGHAVNFHGYVRATEDVDIVFLRTTISERNLLNALENLP